MGIICELQIEGTSYRRVRVQYALDSNPEREILSPFTKEFRAWGQLELRLFFWTHSK